MVPSTVRRCWRKGGAISFVCVLPGREGRQMGGEWARRCVRECMDVVIWLIVAKRRTERASEQWISVCEFTLPSSRSSARPDFLPTILGDFAFELVVGGV